MRTSRINEFMYAVQMELNKQFQQFSSKIEDWENEMENAQDRLLHHQRINDDKAFRNNAIARLESKIELLESRIEHFSLKRQKIESCIGHLPQLKALASRLISSSQLSYDFKEYYLPEYRKIAMNLNLPLTTERETVDLNLLQETAPAYRRAKRSEEKRAKRMGN